MKSVTLQGSWRALFFGAFRRQPTSKNYRYKYVAPKIKRMVLNAHTRDLAGSQSESIDVRSDRQLFYSPVQKLREVILQDINGPKDARIDILRKSPVGKCRSDGPTGVLSWQNVAPIFAHPLNPICKTEGTDSTFEYKTTLKLSSQDGQEKLSHVFWPSLAYSKSCQGVGVTREKYEDLTPTVNFVNPSNGKLLPIFPVDEVPDGCDGIGLFPAFVTSQRQFFTGLELCAAVIRHSLCTAQEISDLEAHVSSHLGNATTSSAELPLSETDYPTLKKLMDASNKCKLLWSSGRENDKTCPGDIIRCSLASTKVDFSQLIEECCKHFILFSLVSQASRLKHALEEPASYLDKNFDYSPMDSFVWQELLRVNETALPTTVPEMIEYKNEVDAFLELLSSYYFSIVAEMKSSTRTYLHDGDKVPRAVPVMRTLQEVIRNCKGFHVFYPNLSLYAAQLLPDNSGWSQLEAPALADEELKLNVGCKALTIFKHVTNFENLMYFDRFSLATGLEIEPVAPLRAWKIVILSKAPLPLEIERALIFNSRVYTQCVTDLEEVTLIKHATCEARKMIDQDTFVFLYKLQRPPKVDKEQMVDDIVGRLEEASIPNLDSHA